MLLPKSVNSKNNYANIKNEKKGDQEMYFLCTGLLVRFFFFKKEEDMFHSQEKERDRDSNCTFTATG